MATYLSAPQPAAGWVYGSMRASGFFMILPSEVAWTRLLCRCMKAYCVPKTAQHTENRKGEGYSWWKFVINWRSRPCFCLSLVLETVRKTRRRNDRSRTARRLRGGRADSVGAAGGPAARRQHQDRV